MPDPDPDPDPYDPRCSSGTMGLNGDVVNRESVGLTY
jgi:hypothetical protein